MLTAGYGYYILQISHMGITYGSLIGLVVLFIWFHLASIVIIMGGEFIMACHEVTEYFADPQVIDMTDEKWAVKLHKELKTAYNNLIS